MTTRIAKLAQANVVNEAPKIKNNNALKYCESGPIVKRMSRYKASPAESRQGI